MSLACLLACSLARVSRACVRPPTPSLPPQTNPAASLHACPGPQIAMQRPGWVRWRGSSEEAQGRRPGRLIGGLGVAGLTRLPTRGSDLHTHTICLPVRRGLVGRLASVPGSGAAAAGLGRQVRGRGAGLGCFGCSPPASHHLQGTELKDPAHDDSVVYPLPCCRTICLFFSNYAFPLCPPAPWMEWNALLSMRQARVGRPPAGV